MKISEYLELAKAMNEDPSGETVPVPKIPSKFESLPYVRHFGPIKSKSKDLDADIKPLCMFDKVSGISGTHYLFVGIPNTKVIICYFTKI
jgi:hypothetical protein